jgi:Na+/proline symporter
MPVLPVVLSLLSSVLSAIIILGGAAEIYTQGAMYWLQGIGQWLATIIAGLLFVPLLYPLQLTSSYEVSTDIIT